MNGFNPLWSRSEFAGVDEDTQCQKIHDGYDILKSHDLTPYYFFAPSHTFDLNTLKALKSCTDIRVISDTIATKPYKEHGFVFIPQLGGHCSEMKISGVWTFCLHPNVMAEENFASLESFLKDHRDEFVSFDDLDLSHVKGKSLLSRILSWIYFAQRKFRGIK